MEERFSIHPRLGYLGPRTPTLATHIPQTLDISCVAWKSACHTNNGNRHVQTPRLRIVSLRNILTRQLIEAIDRRRDVHVVYCRKPRLDVDIAKYERVQLNGSQWETSV